jgi:hypothetical protein
MPLITGLLLAVVIGRFLQSCRVRMFYRGDELGGWSWSSLRTDDLIVAAAGIFLAGLNLVFFDELLPAKGPSCRQISPPGAVSLPGLNAVDNLHFSNMK